MTGDLWLDVAWKSGLVAGVALAASLLLRGRAARDRVAILRLGLVLIAALPVMALALPELRIQTCCASLPAPAEARIDPVAGPPTPTGPVQPISAAPVAEAGRPAIVVPPLGDLLAFAYLAGLAALLVKLALGLAALWRWTRDAKPLTHPAWTSALDRAAGHGARPVLRTSPRVASPLSWGWRPSVILVHPDCAARPEQAAAVLEHEMAHVRRGDWPLLMLSRLVTAVLWFNPLVWLLARELARQSELAADERAVQRVDRAAYAQALVTLAGRRVAHAGLSMAAPRGELADRVRVVLSDRTRRAAPWSKAFAALACLALATPLAALEVTEKMAEPLARAVKPITRLVPTARETAPAALVRASTGSAQSAASAASPPTMSQDEEMARSQRDQGVAMLLAGARQLEDQGRRLRVMAETLPAEDRPEMFQEALDLENEARGLRAEADDLASGGDVVLRFKDKPNKPDLAQAADQSPEYRAIESMVSRELLRAAGDVRVLQNPDGSLWVEADQMIRPVGADVAAAQAGTTAEEAEHLRRQADALRRQAGEIEARAARIESGGMVLKAPDS